MKIREVITESLLPQPKVMTADVTPYELSKLMQEFRAMKDADINNRHDNAFIAFYTDEERAEFAKFLSKRGVKHNMVKDD